VLTCSESTAEDASGLPRVPIDRGDGKTMSGYDNPPEPVSASTFRSGRFQVCGTSVNFLKAEYTLQE